MLIRTLNVLGSFLSAVVLSLALIGCGAADPTATSTTGGTSTASAEETEVAAAAAASLFSGGVNASVSALRIPQQTLARFVEDAQEEQDGEYDQGEGQYEGDDYEGHDEGNGEGGYGRDCGENDPACTCADASGENGDSDGPSAVTMASSGEEGHYGSLEEGLDLVSEDFCANADGEDNEGLGPDGKGRFAVFTLDGEVLGSCVNENNETTTIAMQSGSTGVFRNTNESEGEAAHYPEIYGTFNYLINGEDEVTLDCTIFLSEDGSIAFANCSDENGTVVETDDSSECQISDE